MPGKEIEKNYGNKLRIRVCGICVQDQKILLVNHQGLGKNGLLWIPPGGGVNFGESLEDSLVREFKEETSLEIKVEKFLFVNEFIDLPLHAIELFFKVTVLSGDLCKGQDPEMKKSNQIIQEVKFIDFQEIQKDLNLFHNMFKYIHKLDDIETSNTFIKYKD